MVQRVWAEVFRCVNVWKSVLKSSNTIPVALSDSGDSRILIKSVKMIECWKLGFRKFFVYFSGLVRGIFVFLSTKIGNEMSNKKLSVVFEDERLRSMTKIRCVMVFNATIIVTRLNSLYRNHF